jgi:predicted nucleic acid-binding protein
VWEVYLASIFWDSNLFIYLFEEHPQFGEPVRSLRRRMRIRGDRLFTSCLTVGEILVKPVRCHNKEVADRYTGLFSRTGITVLPFDFQAASRYAHIRQHRTISHADAIQLAIAASAGIDLFVTNDERLSKVIVPGIHFVSSLERAPV